MISEVAQTIYDQLGPRTFQMLGARDIVASTTALSFRVMRTRKAW